MGRTASCCDLPGADCAWVYEGAQPSRSAWRVLLLLRKWVNMSSMRADVAVRNRELQGGGPLEAWGRGLKRVCRSEERDMYPWVAGNTPPAWKYVRARC